MSAMCVGVRNTHIPYVCNGSSGDRPEFMQDKMKARLRADSLAMGFVLSFML